MDTFRPVLVARRPTLENQHPATSLFSFLLFHFQQTPADLMPLSTFLARFPFTPRLRRITPFLLAVLFLLPAALPASSASTEKHVLLIGGSPSHPPGQHEHNAGVLLLQHSLQSVEGLKTHVSLNGFPEDLTLLERVDTILIYSDGGPDHIALADANFAALRAAMSRGAGLVLLHYAVIPTREKGHDEFLAWIGGTYETHWSVNPLWTAEFTTLPEHPVTRGVRPFTLQDEWYFHLRFVPGLAGVTPLLVAVPPTSTMRRPDGEHSGNPHVRAAVARGDSQILAWAFERPTGGRGFGLTGAHFHDNWAHDDLRTLVLNAIVWTAGLDVPARGVTSKVTPDDLSRNLDDK